MTRLSCEELAIRREQTQQRIIKTLLKRNIRVILDNKDNMLVVYIDKDKTKLGWMNKRYIHRYGIDTFLVMTPKSITPWIRSSRDMKDIDETILENIKSGNISEYEEFSIDMLTSIEW